MYCSSVGDLYIIFFFFFQAEDGIRDKLVTGVQTCALPISLRDPGAPTRGALPRARDLCARPRRAANLEVLRVLDRRLAGDRAVEARAAARPRALPRPVALLRHARRARRALRARGEPPARPDGAGDRRDP